MAIVNVKNGLARQHKRITSYNWRKQKYLEKNDAKTFSGWKLENE
jgi:hypothetical protein